ncbi:MAG: hypothetical protein IPJ98_17670 [Bryobacterales bacterium]|nr:hypothetical protein [Bryobacterales bacterium]
MLIRADLGWGFTATVAHGTESAHAGAGSGGEEALDLLFGEFRARGVVDVFGAAVGAGEGDKAADVEEVAIEAVRVDPRVIEEDKRGVAIAPFRFYEVDVPFDGGFAGEHSVAAEVVAQHLLVAGIGQFEPTAVKAGEASA